MNTSATPTPLLQSAALAILCALALTNPGEAQAGDNYYRWIDERGETILSDRPPAPGTDYEIVSAKSRTTQTVAGDGEDAARDTELDGDRATAGSAASQKDPEACKIAMSNLDALMNSDQVTLRNDKGEVSVLSDKQRAEHIETTKQHINSFCE